MPIKNRQKPTSIQYPIVDAVIVTDTDMKYITWTEREDIIMAALCGINTRTLRTSRNGQRQLTIQGGWAGQTIFKATLPVRTTESTRRNKFNLSVLTAEGCYLCPNVVSYKHKKWTSDTSFSINNRIIKLSNGEGINC